MEQDKVYRQVEANVDRLADQNVAWSVPVTREQVENARNGAWTISISGRRALPRGWFPPSLAGLNVLCLAGAGGQQAPLLAAAGARVTVLDLSENMLARDRAVALRDGLDIWTLHGNMCDPSAYPPEGFDVILNPPSLFYVPDVRPVYRACFGALKAGGALILCAPNPVNYLCEYDEARGEYVARNRLPYRSYEHGDQGDWIEFGHTLEDYLGGLTQVGFRIEGFFEDGFDEQNSDAPFQETCFVARAVKGSENAH